MTNTFAWTDLIEILSKLTPVLALIFLGALIGRFLKTPREVISKFLIYGLAGPTFAFNTMTRKLDGEIFVFTGILYILACVLSGLVFYVTRWVGFDDRERRIAAFSAGTANTGYFGLAAVPILVGEHSLPVLVTLAVALLFFEYTVGAYFLARNEWSPKIAILKIAKIPTFYGVFLGLFLSRFEGVRNAFFTQDLARTLKGSYVTLGLVALGMSLFSQGPKHGESPPGERSRDLSYRVGTTLFLFKFLVWPSVIGLLIYLDGLFTQCISSELAAILRILSVCPLAVNVVLMPSLFGVSSKRSAIWVVCSVAISILLIIFIYK